MDRLEGKACRQETVGKSDVPKTTPAAFVALALGGMLSSVCHAAWVKLDDFQGYAINTNLLASTTDPWKASPGGSDPNIINTSATGVADPTVTNVGNLVGQIGQPQNWTHAAGGSSFYTDQAISIPSQGTFFLKMRVDGNYADTYTGMSTSAMPNYGATNPRVQVGNNSFNNTTFPISSNNLRYRQWYGYWFQVDRANKNWKIFVQSQDGVDYATPTQIASGTWTTVPGPAFESWWIGNTKGNPVFIDDAYYNNTELSTANPIPEPASLALLASGGLLLLRRRRVGAGCGR